MLTRLNDEGGDRRDEGNDGLIEEAKLIDVTSTTGINCQEMSFHAEDMEQKF